MNYENSITREYVLHFYGVSDTKVLSKGNYNGITYSSSTLDELSEFEVNDTYYLFKNIIENTKFRENNTEIANYSLEVVKNMDEISKLHDMQLQEYYRQELNLNESQFFQLCYDIGDYEVKKSLIIGMVANCEGINIKTDDIKKYLRKHSIDFDSYNNDDKQKIYVNYKILEQKVILYLKKSNYAL